jgi:tetraacyldisaccharide 4'-kinase
LQSKDEIGSGPFFAFCGLGNPDAFLSDLRNWGLAICGQKIFPDHYRYTARDITVIIQAGKQAGANAFVTTEKDAQNFSVLNFGEAPLYISVIDLEVTPEADFRNILDQTLAARSRSSA